MYAVAAAVYKLYPFYIIMYDIGVSFTFTFILSAKGAEQLALPGPNRASRAAANDDLCRALHMHGSGRAVVMSEESCLACEQMWRAALGVQGADTIDSGDAAALRLLPCDPPAGGGGV